jgi:DNA-binding IclR family transcriptional regulator
MSVAAIRRSFSVIHHLQTQGEARFTDLVRLLAPISRTALSHLLNSLEEIGELERCERRYRLAPTAAALAGGDRAIYVLPPALRAKTHAVLERVAQDCRHSCALFARVGGSTMKIMDQHNLPQPHWPFGPVGCEWPLVPFHGFARVFLAHAPESVARECYQRWLPYLGPNVRLAASHKSFVAELAKVRRHGYAIEYKDEAAPLLRVAVPISCGDSGELRFAVGVVANYVYLLEVDRCLEVLRPAARDLAEVLKDKVPATLTGRVDPSEGESTWTECSPGRANVTEFSEGQRSGWRPQASESEERILAVG